MQLSILLLATSALAVVSGQLYAREASPELDEYLEARDAYLEARDAYVESAIYERQIEGQDAPVQQKPKVKKPKKQCPPGSREVGHYGCHKIGGPMPKSAPRPNFGAIAD